MDPHIKELAHKMGVEPYSFSPYTDANDANQLAVFLTQIGYEVHVMWPSGKRLDLRGRVMLYKTKREAVEYFDKEMFGAALARAALEVINDS